MGPVSMKQDRNPMGLSPRSEYVNDSTHYDPYWALGFVCVPLVGAACRFMALYGALI